MQSIEVAYSSIPNHATSVGGNREPCKNGWTGRNAVWNVESRGPQKSCTPIIQGANLPREEAVLGMTPGFPARRQTARKLRNMDA